MRAIVEIPQSSRISHPSPEAQPFQEDEMQFHAIEVASDDLESKTKMENESEFESKLESNSEEPNDNDND